MPNHRSLRPHPRQRWSSSEPLPTRTTMTKQTCGQPGVLHGDEARHPCTPPKQKSNFAVHISESGHCLLLLDIAVINGLPQASVPSSHPSLRLAAAPKLQAESMSKKLRRALRPPSPSRGCVSRYGQGARLHIMTPHTRTPKGKLKVWRCELLRSWTISASIRASVYLPLCLPLSHGLL